MGIVSMGIMGLGVWMTSARSRPCLFLLPPLLLLRLLLQRLAHSADTLLDYRKRNKDFRTARFLSWRMAPPVFRNPVRRLAAM